MPWCPKCGYEYKAGYKICSDCNVELVDKLEALEDDSLKATDELENYDQLTLTNEYIEEADDIIKEPQSNRNSRNINDKNAVYVDAKVRASEYKLGAITLLMVGLIGIIVIMLMDLGIVPFLPAVSKVLLNVVMGGLFIIFIIMGISSIGSYKKMLKLADIEEKLKADIEEYFKNNVSVDSLSVDDMLNLTKEEVCLKQYEQIANILNNNFENVDPAFLEYITEKIYVNMFE